MITSIFKKSEPINILIVIGYVLIVCGLKIYFEFHTLNISITNLVANALLVILFIFIFEFIITKNQLTKKNSFGILSYGLLLGLFPEFLFETSTLLAHFFVLLALRRIISLHTGIQMSKKLFDATLLIAIATLFYGLTVVFFLLIVLALFYYSNNNWKHIFMPFIALATFLVLISCYSILKYDSFMLNYYKDFSVSFNYTYYYNSKYIMRLIILLISVIISIVYMIKIIRVISTKQKPTFIIVFGIFIVSVVIIVFANNKQGSEFLFLSMPLAIMFANALNRISKLWFKELMVLVIIIATLISFFIPII